MRPPVRQIALVGVYIIASLVVMSALLGVPQSIRIALGILIAFILPGFVILSAIGPDLQLSWIELVLASLGISISMATCVAVLLGATPVGLSRASFSIALGGSTMACSIYAFEKLERGSDKWQQEARECGGRAVMMARKLLEYALVELSRAEIKSILRRSIIRRKVRASRRGHGSALPDSHVSDSVEDPPRSRTLWDRH